MWCHNCLGDMDVNEYIFTVKIVCTQPTIEVNGRKMGMTEWAYTIIKSNGDYDNAGIVDVLIEETDD